MHLRVLPLTLLLVALCALLLLWQPWAEDVPSDHSDVDVTDNGHRAQLAGKGDANPDADAERGARGATGTEDAGDPDTLPLQVPYRGRIGLICKTSQDDGNGNNVPAPGVPLRLSLWFGDESKEQLLTATTDATGEVRIGPFDLPRVPRHRASDTSLMLFVGNDEWGENDFWLDEELLDDDTLRNGSEDLEVEPAVFDGDVAWITLESWHERAVLLTGRVVTEDGHPLIHPNMTVTGGLTGNIQAWSTDGTFKVSLSRGGEVTLRVAHPGFDRLTFEKTFFVPEPDGLRDVEFVVPSPLSIEGTVALPNGTPLQRSALVLTHANEDLLELAPLVQRGKRKEHDTWLRAWSDDGGRFAFRGLKTGAGYAIWWFDDAGVPHRLPQEYHAGDRDLTITIDRHRFAVHLIDARTKERILGEELYVQPADGKDRRGPLTNASYLRTEGYDESYWISFPGDEYRITAFARGYAPVAVTHTIRKAPGTEVVRIPMEPTSGLTVLRARVVDHAGRELPDLEPEVVSKFGKIETSPLVQFIRRDGAWETRELGPGTVELRVDGQLGRPEHEPSRRFALYGEVTVELPEKGIKEMDLRLPQGGALRITCRQPDGKLGRDFLNFLLVDDGGGLQPLGMFRNDAGRGWVQERRAGREAESQAVKPGSYTLRVVGQSVPGWKNEKVLSNPSVWLPVETPVTIVAGKITDVDVALVKRDG